MEIVSYIFYVLIKNVVLQLQVISFKLNFYVNKYYNY